MSYKILDQNGNPVKRKGTDGEDHEILGSAKGGVVKGIALDKRTITMIGSDESTDRDGDNILTAGWLTDNYRKNSVFLWSHMYSQPPLGGTKKLSRKRSPWRLEFLIEFIKAGISPFSDMIFEMFGDRKMNASSVGFIPYEWDEKTKDEIESEGLHPFVYHPRKFKKQELLELSAVSVPSNPNAIQVIDGESAKETVEFADEWQKMSDFITVKGFKGFEVDPMKVLRCEESLVLTPDVQERVENEIGEILHKGIEFEDDFDQSFIQVEEDLTPDKDIDSTVDYNVSISEIREIDSEIADELTRLFDEGLIGVSLDRTVLEEVKGFDVEKVVSQLKTLLTCVQESIKFLEDLEVEDLADGSDETSIQQETETAEEDKFQTMLFGMTGQRQVVNPPKVVSAKAPAKRTGELVNLISKVSDLAESVGKLEKKLG